MLTIPEIYSTKRALLHIHYADIADAIGKSIRTVKGVLGENPAQFFSEDTARRTYEFIDTYQAKILADLARLDSLKN